MQVIGMKFDRGSQRRGDIIEVRATGSPFVGKEPDDFFMVEVGGLPVAEFDHLNKSWRRSLAFEVAERSVPLDRYRLRIYSDNANSTLGALARNEIEAFIVAWGGTVVSDGPNEVVCDMTVYDALTSTEFWEFDISNVVFTELSYDEGTGVHRIQADYSATDINNPTYPERRAMQQHATIISHSNKVLVYKGSSANVVDDIQAFIRNRTDRKVASRQYYFGETVVSHIESQGGTVTTDRATFETYIRDKVAD